MRVSNRDLLVLMKNEFASQQAIEKEMLSIHDMLGRVESDEQFCQAHELVTRRRITAKPRRILKAVRHADLKPFVFLLNRN